MTAAKQHTSKCVVLLWLFGSGRFSRNTRCIAVVLPSGKWSPATPSVTVEHAQWTRFTQPLSGLARGGFGVFKPPHWKMSKKFSEDKIVEKTQRWSLHVLYRHQTTLFAQTKVTYLLTHSLIVSKPWSGPATTPTQRLVITHIQMTVRVQQMDVPKRGCNESRRESRMGYIRRYIRSALRSA